jgi:6-phosphogluconolactonase
MIRQGINIFDGIPEIAAGLCRFLASETIKKTYSIALSGGNTPKAVFESMSSGGPGDVPWNKIHFFWGDERCVGSSHPDSNYRMAFESLLSPLKIGEAYIHRIIGESDPDYEADRYTVEILKNVDARDGYASFDLIILGMGDDGHTASIFPGQDKIISSTRVCEMSAHPVSGQKRITLTMGTINNAKNIFFLVTGNKKAKLVSDIINKKRDWGLYPAAMVNPIHGKLCWLLDREAASGL